MDPRVYGFSGSMKRVQLGNQFTPVFSDPSGSNIPNFQAVYGDQELFNGSRADNSESEQNLVGIQSCLHGPLSSNAPLTSHQGAEDDYDDDFSDAGLRYINQILMEEEMEDKIHMLQESLELEAKERSFYEALGKNYPPTPEQNPTFIHQNSCFITDDYEYDNYQKFIGNSSEGSDSLIKQSSESPGDYEYRNHHNCITDNAHGRGSLFDPASIDIATYYSSSYFHGYPSSTPNSIADGSVESSLSSFSIPNVYGEGQPNNELLPNFDINELLTQEPMSGAREMAGTVEKKDERKTSLAGSRVRKSPHRDVSVEQRSSKQAALYTESPVRSEEFDIVLLHSMGRGEEALLAYHKNLKNATCKNMQQNGNSKGSSRGKGRGKKQKGKRDVDLRAFMISCAQAVAADDHKSAYELLNQIRQHSSPFGDGNQRLANYFADGLEARLAGTGSLIYKALVNKRTTAADYLKAYHLYLASCPFNKISCLASNKTIYVKCASAMRIHVIDFGILYGFQWPTFIQRIAARSGGPPRVRITGIEFPQPGFRPAERIEETGRRLADYAQSFNVPFEYNGIAKRWESITIEDLKLDKDEFLVVNCLYRFENLLDETELLESSKTLVLNLIRKINPDLFIHGNINGSYSAPFFVTRFREAMFHFSALFDMLETNVPRDIPERMLIERDIFGRQALNIIACEGWERVERPETYKQWQVRNMRAGFTPIPFVSEITDLARERVRTCYHKDFVIDEDGQWLLLGWKGRIIYGISCWVPV